ncbi:MAG TPA: thermonuclease family protein [Candidatus Binatia bacterium]|nr:thermonuclease family protein [Candidatus Binatia bacterium]
MRLTREFRLAAIVFVLALGIGLATMPLPPVARGEPSTDAKSESTRSSIGTPRFRVIDGDTLEDRSADIIYRIENIDTPETGPRARCQAERDLGNRATQQARALVSSGDVELRSTGRTDRYGRTIAFVLIDGRDLGERLIADGLARPWRGRREPWCDAVGNLIP